MTRLTLRPGLLATLGLALPACTGPLNMSVSPGEEPLPTFAEADRAAEIDPAAPPVMDPPDDTPSLNDGHDRAAWETYTVVVPVYRVQTNPTPDYRELVFIDDTPRQRREFPSNASALDNNTTAPAEYGEGIFDIFAGLGSIVLSPFYMVARDWEPSPRSPQHRFEMSPEVRTEDYDRWIRVGTPDDTGMGMTPEPINEDPEP